MFMARPVRQGKDEYFPTLAGEPMVGSGIYSPAMDVPVAPQSRNEADPANLRASRTSRESGIAHHLATKFLGLQGAVGLACNLS